MLDRISSLDEDIGYKNHVAACRQQSLHSTDQLEEEAPDAKIAFAALHKPFQVRELEKTLEALRSGSGSGPRTAAEVRGAVAAEDFKAIFVHIPRKV